ncbi:MAG: helix-turn-helix domain-containing protein [Mycobacterium sp.]
MGWWPRHSPAPQAAASELRERLAKGESATALATEYRVSRQTVYNYKTA